MALLLPWVVFLSAPFTKALSTVGRKAVVKGAFGGLVALPAFAEEPSSSSEMPSMPSSMPSKEASLEVSSSSAPSTGLTGLVRFPPLAPLRNEYVLVRAGECAMDRAGLIMTNAAFKMSQEECSLTDRGQREAFEAAATVELLTNGSPLVFYDTGRASQETAEIIANRLGLQRDRFVPEFVLLEARGFGAHERERQVRIPELHAAYDVQSRYLKPPEGEDGAYAESIEDVVCRFRQVLSKCETMFCGERIVLVAPGRDYFSIGATAFAGVDPRTHCQFPFESMPWDNTGRVAALTDAADRALSLAAAPTTVPLLESKEPGRAWADATRLVVERQRADAKKVARDLEWSVSESTRRSKVLRLKKDLAALEKPKVQTSKAALGVGTLLGLGFVSLLGGNAQSGAEDNDRLDANNNIPKVVPAPVRIQEPRQKALDHNGDPYFTTVHDYGPCPQGDDLCLAAYLNEDDDGWLRNIKELKDGRDDFGL